MLSRFSQSRVPVCPAFCPGLCRGFGSSPLHPSLPVYDLLPLPKGFPLSRENEDFSIRGTYGSTPPLEFD